MFIISDTVFSQCAVQATEILCWVCIWTVILQLTTTGVVFADITHVSNGEMSSRKKECLSNESSDLPPSCQCEKCQHAHHFQCNKTEFGTT